MLESYIGVNIVNVLREVVIEWNFFLGLFIVIDNVLNMIVVVEELGILLVCGEVLKLFVSYFFVRMRWEYNCWI